MNNHESGDYFRILRAWCAAEAKNILSEEYHGRGNEFEGSMLITLIANNPKAEEHLEAIIHKALFRGVAEGKKQSGVESLIDELEKKQ